MKSGESGSHKPQCCTSLLLHWHTITSNSSGGAEPPEAVAGTRMPSMISQQKLVISIDSSSGDFLSADFHKCVNVPTAHATTVIRMSEAGPCLLELSSSWRRGWSGMIPWRFLVAVHTKQRRNCLQPTSRRPSCVATTCLEKLPVIKVSKALILPLPGLSNVMVYVAATQADLLEVANTFFAALYGQPPGTSMESSRFTLFTKNKKVPKSWPCLRHPPTCCCISWRHIYRWCYDNQQTRNPYPLSLLISLTFVWRYEMISLFLPPELMDAIVCRCSAKKQGSAALRFVAATLTTFHVHHTAIIPLMRAAAVPTQNEEGPRIVLRVTRMSRWC